jgi:hypothetical protein
MNNNKFDLIRKIQTLFISIYLVSNIFNQHSETHKNNEIS